MDLFPFSPFHIISCLLIQLEATLKILYLNGSNKEEEENLLGHCSENVVQELTVKSQMSEFLTSTLTLPVEFSCKQTKVVFSLKIIILTSTCWVLFSPHHNTFSKFLSSLSLSGTGDTVRAPQRSEWPKTLQGSFKNCLCSELHRRTIKTGLSEACTYNNEVKHMRTTTKVKANSCTCPLNEPPGLGGKLTLMALSGWSLFFFRGYIRGEDTSGEGHSSVH